MCTRFVYRGSDIITGFNFDISLAEWNHQVIKEKERFYIGASCAPTESVTPITA